WPVNVLVDPAGGMTIRPGVLRDDRSKDMPCRDALLRLRTTRRTGRRRVSVIDEVVEDVVIDALEVVSLEHQITFRFLPKLTVETIGGGQLRSFPGRSSEPTGGHTGFATFPIF